MKVVASPFGPLVVLALQEDVEPIFNLSVRRITPAITDSLETLLCP
ncbi:MAG: hypothetical protein JWM11_7249 [Planctomycetaceae bacterium]|nr:hypothetical protein [Planctomycetaceae bacterium]